MRPAIAVMLDAAASYGRGVLRGIEKYQRERPTVGGLYFGTQLPPPTEELHIRGVISQGVSEVLDASVGPVVNISGRPIPLPHVSVITDDVAVGRMAAEFFLERKFRHFLYCGFADHGLSLRRKEGFVQTLNAAGYPCELCELSNTEPLAVEQQKQFLAFLRSSPRPLAVLTCNDKRARRIVQKCADLQIRVPDEVAILGVDDDEYESMRSLVPLASVRLNTERIGYEAMALLHSMIDGAPPLTEPRLISPLAVIVRQSADVLGIHDKNLQMAMEFISEHYRTQIGVQDLVDHLLVSRRQLERAFSRTLGRTPLSEIRRTRIAVAKRLLACTDLTVALIAEESGFLTASRLIVVFREETGITPTAYRQQQKLGIGREVSTIKQP